MRAVQPGRVAVGIHFASGRVLIAVDVSAPGVAAADVPRLFEPLFRTDPARTRARGGSGLGLAIGEAIARAHGGRMAALGSALGGLRIEIELPVVARRAA